MSNITSEFLGRFLGLAGIAKNKENTQEYIIQRLIELRDEYLGYEYILEEEAKKNGT